MNETPKVPIWLTIDRSYRFVFPNYVALFGAVWVPLVVSDLLIYILIFPVLRRVGEALRDNNAAAFAAALQDAAPWGVAFAAISLAAIAVISVAVTKQALGAGTRSKFVYVDFGLAELRVIGGYFLFVVSGFVYVLSAAFIAGSLVYVVLMLATGGGNSITPVVLYNSIQPWLIRLIEASYLYFAVRFMSFMTAATVVDHRFGPWRSWKLSKNNVAALVVIAVATVVPALLCQSILGLAVFAPALAHMHGLAASSPSGIIGSGIHFLLPVVPWLWIVQLAIAPLVYGLSIAPAAFAYQSATAGTREDV